MNDYMLKMLLEKIEGLEKRLEVIESEKKTETTPATGNDLKERFLEALDKNDETLGRIVAAECLEKLRRVDPEGGTLAHSAMTDLKDIVADRTTWISYDWDRLKTAGVVALPL